MRILENMTELSLGPAAAFSIFVIVVVLVVTKGLDLLLRLLGGRPAGLHAGGARVMVEVRLEHFPLNSTIPCVGQSLRCVTSLWMCIQASC